MNIYGIEKNIEPCIRMVNMILEKPRACPVSATSEGCELPEILPTNWIYTNYL